LDLLVVVWVMTMVMRMIHHQHHHHHHHHHHHPHHDTQPDSQALAALLPPAVRSLLLGDTLGLMILVREALGPAQLDHVGLLKSRVRRRSTIIIIIITYGSMVISLTFDGASRSLPPSLWSLQAEPPTLVGRVESRFIPRGLLAVRLNLPGMVSSLLSFAAVDARMTWWCVQKPRFDAVMNTLLVWCTGFAHKTKSPRHTFSSHSGWRKIVLRFH
jgi:hypothetical protein